MKRIALLGLFLLACQTGEALAGIAPPTKTPSQAQLIASGNPSYAELCDRKATTNLTRAQADAYIQKIKGTRISGWKRYVWQVDSVSALGVTLYQVLLTDKINLSTWNIQVTTRDKIALELKKGDLWEFSGIVKSGSVVESGVCMFYIDSN